MSLTLLSNTAPLSVGERMVTLGSKADTPFVPEIPVGYITSVTPPSGSFGRQATVKPYVDFSALDIVAVVIGSPKAPKHDSLLPPKPTPSAPSPSTSTTPSTKPKK